MQDPANLERPRMAMENVSVVLAHGMAERMKAKIKAHAVDHTPSVTAPTVVVDIIRDAIRFVTGN
jgi:hypothetical protein